MRLHPFLATIALPIMLLTASLGGCPSSDASTPGTTDLQTTATAPPSITAGDTALLEAKVADGASGVSYHWYQTFGVAVTLVDDSTALASFVAPSLANDAVVRFRVDARVGTADPVSADVSVTIAADPNFGAVPADDGSGATLDPMPKVRITTSMGDIVVQLNRTAAPLTVNNFLRYVDDGFYDGTIFHRVIKDFVVQGGGFEPSLVEKQTRDPIRLESNNGLKNVRGTIAMARQTAPDTATSQFYFNLVDNDSLNYMSSSMPGYAVFGSVTEGLDVIDAIGDVTTGSQNGFMDVPVEDVLINKVVRVTE